MPDVECGPDCPVCSDAKAEAIAAVVRDEVLVTEIGIVPPLIGVKGEL